MPKPQNAGPNYKNACPNHKNACPNTKKRANARQKTSKSDHQIKSLKILKIPNKKLYKIHKKGEIIKKFQYNINM